MSPPPIPEPFASALAAWLGGSLGSFANVLIHRLPREQSVVRPRSRCPRCKAAIAAYDNIPVLSWLWLRGRCRRCAKPIPWRYPAVELVVALLGVALWRRWAEHPLWAFACIVAAALLVAVAAIDWETFLIPDELSLGLLALGLAIAPLNPILNAQGPWRALLGSMVGGAIGFALCYAVAELGERIFKKEAMGGGDIKLLAAVGAWTGGVGAFDCLMIGSFLGSAYGLWVLARGRLKRADPIPFGPFLSAGALFNLFVLLPLGFPFS